jgi:hypothetical protein
MAEIVSDRVCMREKNYRFTKKQYNLSNGDATRITRRRDLYEQITKEVI